MAAPPTPPKNRRTVGPLRPSPRGQLAPGDAVEVRQLARGSRGSWRAATVKQVPSGPCHDAPRPAFSAMHCMVCNAQRHI